MSKRNQAALSEEAQMTKFICDRKSSGRRKQQNRQQGKQTTKWFDRFN